MPRVTFDLQAFKALDWGNGEYGFLTALADESGHSAKFDDITRALTVINYEHHEIHEGDSFVSSYVADVGNGGSINLAITTPDSNRYAHMVVNVITESEAQLDMYEGATISGGTAVAAVCRRRPGAGTASCAVVHTPSVSAAGTAIFTKHWGAGKTSGAENRDANEWILNKSLNYLVSVTNATTSNNQISVWLDWYEHTDA